MLWRNLFKRQANPLPAVAPGGRIFAIGDIHGRLDLLDALLEEIARYTETTPPAHQNLLVFLGDYVDRGPDSRAVIHRLIHLKQTMPSWNCVFLRGNHDQTVLDFLADSEVYRSWRSYGGANTLLSYDVAPPRFDDETDFVRARDELASKMPLQHLQFLQDLEYSYSNDGYIFVHAGLRPGLALADQSPQDMMWIRDDFLLHNRKFEKIVVHGHTPSPSAVNLHNRIGVDTGAHATGLLTAVVLEGDRRVFLEAIKKKRPADASAQLSAVNS